MKKNFDWNGIDWSKYPNGIILYKIPITGIKMGSKIRENKMTVSYWNEKEWIKLS